MKRSQFILLVLFVVISGFIYIALTVNQKEKTKELKAGKETTYVPVRKVKSTPRKLALTSYGQVTPNAQIMVAFEVQGTLQKGEMTMKPGTNFSIGQILYRIDNQEAYYALNARKSALSNLLLNALPDIELDFPSERNKWVRFLGEISPSKRIPDLPKMSSREQMFMIGRNILAEYYNLRSQEARIEKYVFVAPFNGTVIATFAEPGSIVNPGVQVAQIARTGNFEVKVPISIDDLSTYQEKSTAHFTDASGTLIGKGEIIRVSNVINQQTQSADVYYTIRPEKDQKIFNGMHLNVSIEKEAHKEVITLPRTAVKDSKIMALTGTKIKSIPIRVIGSKSDSLFVEGVDDGTSVLLEHVEDIRDHMEYKGINR